MDYWVERNMLRLIFALSAALLSAQVSAQEIDLITFSKAVETSNKIRPEEAYGLFADTTNCIKGNTSFGFSRSYFWILVDLPDGLDLTKQYFLDIDNPHIDMVQVYRISNGQLGYVGRSGDRMPFSERTYENRRNVFPVEFLHPNDQVLFFIDKRNASVTVPITLWTRHGFLQHEYRSNLIYGLYFGMLLIIMVYSLLIYVVQRSSIYLWYMVYVLSLFLYLFTHVGYGFQFLFPDQYEWNNYLRLIMLISILITLIRFTQLYLPVRLVAVGVNKIFYVVIVALIGILLWWVTVPGLFTANTIVVINSIYGFMAFAILLMFIVLFRSWKVARTEVLFYSAAFGVTILAGSLMIFEEYGFLQLSWLPVPPIFIGSLFEILIFAVGLSYRSKLIGDDRRKLLADINHLQQQAMQSFVRGMEEEKVRVANELHDDVASRLSLLAIKLNEYSDEELEGQIKIIKEGVRRISHQLNPVALDEETFLGMAKLLVSEYRSMGVNIDFQVFDVGTFIPQEIGLQLYRVLQEALQNMQKHSEAALAEIQIFQHGNELVMTIEDDGVGFEQTESQVGLGLKNMQLRIEQVGGQFSISSAVDEGTSIMVSVPFNVE